MPDWSLARLFLNPEAGRNATIPPELGERLDRFVRTHIGREDWLESAFELIDRTWLEAATACEPATIAVADRYGLEWTLNLAIWLDVYQPHLVL